DVELEQFEISDERSASSVEDMIRAKGFDPVWRDWHSAYSG
ncbi:2-iminoacetate synthase ThiH, partial [Vibrio diabolicus]